MARKRLDELLVERGLAADRKEAEALILRGAVLVDEQRQAQAGKHLPPDSCIRVRRPAGRYVSRGGDKLEGALAHFGLTVEGWTCLDLGASTGGFTDCLLQRGAGRVYAFDVGRGQLDWKLRNDPRVKVRDAVNVRYLERSWVSERIDLITIDLSFISLRRILPRLKDFHESLVLALVKPQFEAARNEVESGGLIRDPDKQREIVRRIQSFASAEGFALLGECPSQLPGQKGNQEYFVLLRSETSREAGRMGNRE